LREAFSYTEQKGKRSPNLSVGGSYGTGYSDARKSLTGFEQTGVLDTIGTTTASIPVVTPVYNYNYETTSFKDQFSDNINQSFGFNLSIPIFNGLGAKTSITRAMIALENAEYDLQLKKNQLKKDIQQAFADANAALKKYHATIKTVSALQEAFSYTEQKFNVGMVTSVEYNDSNNKLAKSKSELLQAKYEYVFKTKILDFFQGRSLVF